MWIWGGGLFDVCVIKKDGEAFLGGGCSDEKKTRARDDYSILFSNANYCLHWVIIVVVCQSRTLVTLFYTNCCLI